MAHNRLGCAPAGLSRAGRSKGTRLSMMPSCHASCPGRLVDWLKRVRESRIQNIKRSWRKGLFIPNHERAQSALLCYHSSKSCICNKEADFYRIARPWPPPCAPKLRCRTRRAPKHSWTPLLGAHGCAVPALATHSTLSRFLALSDPSSSSQRQQEGIAGIWGAISCPGRWPLWPVGTPHPPLPSR